MFQFEGIGARKQILEPLYDQVKKSNVAIDQLIKSGGFLIVLTLLESSDEELRIIALKIIGLLIHDPKIKAAFLKIQGKKIFGKKNIRKNIWEKYLGKIFPRLGLLLLFIFG